MTFTNFAQDGQDNHPKITAVNMDGKPWFEITEATITGAKQTWNGPDSFGFSMSPLSRAAAYIPLKARDFEIKIDLPEQNEPLWGEPVSVRGGPAGITFECVGHMGMLSERFVDRSSLIFEGVPQVEIIEALIEYAQDESKTKYRNLKIVPRVVDPGTLGQKLRSRQYFREEHENILDALKDFQDTTTPVDLKMSYVTTDIYNVGRWIRFLDIMPRYDVIDPYSTPLYYSHKEEVSNIVSFEWAEDANGVVNDVYCGGGSAGNIKFEGHWTDEAAARLHGSRQGIISAGDMTDPDWLEDRARGEVDRRKRPVQTVTIKSVTVAAAIGRYAWVGSIWPLKIDFGRIQVNGNFRIVSRTLAGSRVVTLELQQMQKPIKRPSEVFGNIPYDMQGAG